MNKEWTRIANERGKISVKVNRENVLGDVLGIVIDSFTMSVMLRN